MTERVLVVEDEEKNRELLEAILLQEGYQVRVAADGPTALGLAAEGAADLVLLDILMPGMSGLEVCQRMKQEPATAGLPIIVVTAVGKAAAKEAALTTGADDFVMKPVRPEDLRARVAAMLKVRRIRQELDRTLAYLHELDAARHAHRQQALAHLAAKPQQSVASIPTPMPILLVDDDGLTRKFYGDLLEEHGFEVHAAGSGAEGLARVEQYRPDAVIADIVMPEMTGLEFLERLRTMDADLPVIMLTGHPVSQNAIAALKLGAFDFLVKGLDPNLVALAVHRAIRHRRTMREKNTEVDRLRARVRELEAKYEGRA
ncbi:MAG TPA: response regulator [Candidatus Sulfotelmatobacter sp.]|nr:response regulator [Candidatus Sulfotelmatobacter sp.]